MNTKMQELGFKGGAANRAKFPREHFQKLGRLAAARNKELIQLGRWIEFVLAEGGAVLNHQGLAATPPAKTETTK